MNSTENPLPPVEKPAAHWPSALQFGLGAAAAGTLLAGSFGLTITGIYSAAAGGTESETLSLLIMAASFFGIGLLLAPSVYYGFMRLTGKRAVDSKKWLRRLRPGSWLLFFPIVLLIGGAASQSPPLSWLILPALHVPAIGLPIGWMVYLAGRGLPWGSSQRIWGVFGSGLVLGPLIISILEMIAVAGLGIIAVIYVTSQPELVDELMGFAQSLQGGEISPEEMIERFGPYFMRPEVIFGMLALSAGIVPLIEEALKPIGVWLLVGRPLSPAAGLAAGALSGAGFALTESLLLSSGGASWPLLVLVRMGTGAIHILTSALTGWALAVAWKRGRFGTLAAAYLTAVAIHSLWNGLTVATVFSGLAQTQSFAPAPPLIDTVALVAPPILFLLAGGSLFLLVFYNLRLRHRLARRGSGNSSRLAGGRAGETADRPDDPIGETFR